MLRFIISSFVNDSRHTREKYQEALTVLDQITAAHPYYPRFDYG